ncbi:MAG: hypothetical protein WKG00_29555 [Polyangiaceae bacterium]
MCRLLHSLACLACVAAPIPARAQPLASAAARTPAPLPSCDAALRIDARAEEAERVRAALAGSALRDLHDPACADAVLTVARSGDDWIIALETEGQRVERRVNDLGAAAGWVEGWLTGTALPAEVSAPSSPTPPGPATAAPPRSVEPDGGVRAPAPGSPVAVGVHLDLVTSGAVGNDGSLWGGVELAPRLQVSPTVWFGGGLAAQMDSTWNGPAADADHSSRIALRASMRGGPRLRVAPRLQVFLGAGVGVAWAIATRQLEPDDDDISQGGFFGELMADACVSVSPPLTLLAGVGARGAVLTARGQEDETERRVPDAMPPLTAELHLGAGWTFGSAL